MKLKQLREESDNPTIIVMVGLPGSGKSTWREQFLKNAQDEYVIVSSDDEIEALAAKIDSNYTDAFNKFIGKATAISKQKFREAVNSNESIIWDQTNLTPKKRKGILAQVPNNYRKVAVVFEVTDEELESRLSKRKEETGKDIPPHVIKSMANSYIPPTKQEGFDEIVFA